MMNKSIEEIVEFLIDKKINDYNCGILYRWADRICDRGYSGRI